MFLAKYLEDLEAVKGRGMLSDQQMNLGSPGAEKTEANLNI